MVFVLWYHKSMLYLLKFSMPLNCNSEIPIVRSELLQQFTHSHNHIPVLAHSGVSDE